MKKFKAVFRHSKSIFEIDVIKESEHFVTYLSNGYQIKEKKITDTYQFFDTKDEAKLYLMSRIDRNIRMHQADIDKLKSDKQKVNNL